MSKPTSHLFSEVGNVIKNLEENSENLEFFWNLSSDTFHENWQ